MCSETSEAVGTTWEHAQLEFQKFLKTRITLLLYLLILLEKDSPGSLRKALEVDRNHRAAKRKINKDVRGDDDHDVHDHHHDHPVQRRSCSKKKH